MHGFLNVHKPSGMTSYDVVHAVKRLAAEPHVGHGGTLDPLASGVLLIALGKMTRLLEYVLKRDKNYRASLELGKTSDGYDREGKIEIRKVTKFPTDTEVKSIVQGFVGKIEQTPPAFSAIHVDGVKAYKLARKGVLFSPPSREIEIYSIEILRYEFPHLEISVHCSSGTYIRSLAHDIGQELGTGALLSELCRQAIGEKIRLETAIPLDQFTPENIADRLMPNQAIIDLLGLPTLLLKAEQYLPFQQGKLLPFPTQPRASYCMVNEQQEILGIAIADEQGRTVHPEKVFI